MSSFRISTDWIDTTVEGQPPVDQTFASLGIEVGSEFVTAYESESGERGPRLEVPAYFLAEWIAANYWALLHEPCKNERYADDPGFRSRHWFGSARNGFVLPDMWLFASDEETVSIKVQPASFPHARLGLRAAIDAEVSQRTVSKGFEDFIGQTVKRLDAKGVEDTALQQIWGVQRRLDRDERKYCELIGALGLSPYEDNESIERELTALTEELPEEAVTDLCEAANDGDFIAAAADTRGSLKALETGPTIDIGPISSLAPVSANKPWRMGIDLANRVRGRFSVKATDVNGGRTILGELGLSEVINAKGKRELEDVVVHGAMRRSENELRLNLIRKDPSQRRFDAARGCYMALSQVSGTTRLVTRARVRDQQASRAFAAELLVPREYLRNRVQGIMSNYQAGDIAAELGVTPEVVMWRAADSGIRTTMGSGFSW